MKAIVKATAKPGLALKEVPVPQIGENDLLIQVEKSSICGTDLHLYHWDAWAQSVLPVPCIIGHEFVGRVKKVGGHISHFKVGDRVSGEGHFTCGICEQCMSGRRVLCPHTVGLGVHGPGCFAEFVRLPAENAFPMPNDIPDELACIFDPLGNSVHSASVTDLVGKDVLITGAGPIGLMTIAVAKKMGARHVVISDLNDYRLKIAKKMNATRAVNIKKQSLKSVLEDLKIDGFDVCFEMSGSPKALESMPALSKPGAYIVLLGILPANAPINWQEVIFKMLTIRGIYGREIFSTWQKTAHLLQGGLDISPVITHEFHFEDFEKGFKAMEEGVSGKVILNWGKEKKSKKHK